MKNIRRFSLTLLFAVLGSRTTRAQSATSAFVDVGSEQERRLRILQLTGDVPFYPWTIRAISPAELQRFGSPGPRARSTMGGPKAAAAGTLTVTVLPAEVRLIYNSAFPFGYNDGPIWAGRGLTAAVSAGFAGRFGPVSVQLAPMAFISQNASFPLKATDPGASVFGDGFHASIIDHPQRFGDRSYARFDPGQSTIRLDLGPIAAEVSSADQWWGPAVENPMILGNNAGGFLHGDLGTAHPIDIGIGSIHGRVVYGRLDQSAYSPERGVDTLRFMSGLVFTFMPRGLPGLEIGADRFFHTGWPRRGIFKAPWYRPFEGILKHSLSTSTNPMGDDVGDNQEASAFARWAFPGHGIEVYGEYAREDHNYDLRDLLQEPDHESGFMLGIQRAWAADSNHITVFRGEVLNTRISALQQGRSESAMYIHAGGVSQGHTLRGQLLAAEGGYGGGAALLAVDRYEGANRLTVEWSRLMRGEYDIELPKPAVADVQQILSLQLSRSRGRVASAFGLSGIWDLNRDFAADRFNLNLTSSFRYAW